MERKYYVLDWITSSVSQPMSFRDAFNEQENNPNPTIILKVVVGPDGKEVK